jgi:hypothetical protein
MHDVCIPSPELCDHGCYKALKVCVAGDASRGLLDVPEQVHANDRPDVPAGRHAEERNQECPSHIIIQCVKVLAPWQTMSCRQLHIAISYKWQKALKRQDEGSSQRQSLVM